MPMRAAQERLSVLRRRSHQLVLALAAGLAALLAGCDADQDLTLSVPIPACDPAGTVAVTAVTSGSSLDPDGYTVTLDDGRAFELGVNASVDFGEVNDGGHTVELAGVAANCIEFDRIGEPTARCAVGAEIELHVDCTTALPGLPGRLVFVAVQSLDLDILSMAANGTTFDRLTTSAEEDDDPDWAPARAGLAFTSRRDGQREIYVMAPDGTGQTRLTNNPADDLEPDWSPDGTRIAFTSSRDGRSQVYVMNADGSGQANLGNNDHNESQPAWSPDGSRIAFTSDRQGDPQVFTMAADGSDVVQVTGQGGGSSSEQPAWSPDGTRLLILRAMDVVVVDLESGEEVQLTEGHESHNPVWSPDGAHIAFRSDRLLLGEIFVMRADGSGTFNRTLSVAVESEPDWR